MIFVGVFDDPPRAHHLDFRALRLVARSGRALRLVARCARCAWSRAVHQCSGLVWRLLWRALGWRGAALRWEVGLVLLLSASEQLSEVLVCLRCVCEK